MSRIGLAFWAFFAALISRELARRIQAALAADTLPKIDLDAKPRPGPVSPEPSPPARSEAITLLAALQRESRLVDLIKQPLDRFTDDQIGAAARNVLSDCAAVLDRFFRLQPVIDQEEGTTCDVPKGYDPGCYKIAGQVHGNGPFHGKLVHQGWQANTVKLPAWTGSNESALVIAPAEVEV
jgi:Domain of unknown function (DUF2760)